MMMGKMQVSLDLDGEIADLQKELGRILRLEADAMKAIERGIAGRSIAARVIRMRNSKDKEQE